MNFINNKKELVLDFGEIIDIGVKKPLQEKTVTPTKEVQVVTADNEDLELSKVTVEAIPAEYIKPSGKVEITDTNEVDTTNYSKAQVVDTNLIAANIKDGVKVLGIEGTYDNRKEEQEKTVTPSKETQEVTADTTEMALSKVIVEPIPNEYIVPSGKVEIKDTNEVDVTQYAAAQVVDENLTAENIKAGVSVLGIEGTHEGVDEEIVYLNILATKYGGA